MSVMYKIKASGLNTFIQFDEAVRNSTLDHSCHNTRAGLQGVLGEYLEGVLEKEPVRDTVKC